MSADVRPIKTAAEIALAETFAAIRTRLPGNGAVASRREDAFRRFENQGLPHRRIEEWKYTDLRTLMRTAKPLGPGPDAASKQRAKVAGSIVADVAARRIVFAEGVFVPELSDLAELESGLSITSLAQALAARETDVVARLSTPGLPEGDVAAALNTAFMGDGAVIRIAKGAAIARPLHLVFAHGGDKATAEFTRSLVEIGEGAQTVLIESHEGPDGLDYQVNSALDLYIGDRARVDYLKVGSDGSSALHIATLAATVGANAEFNTFTFTVGGGLTRNQLFVRCAGKDSIVGLRGANLLKDRQHVDTTLVLEHAVPGCTSREMFKSVLDGASRGVFQGKIIVRPGAQQSDARMMTNALLLSETAEADNKPELEIFADDVQCGHGATAGALDENLKFYLMARGISESEAESLLIQAFVGEAVEAVNHEGLKEALMAVVVRWLQARGS
ncbi:MAG: Fe-S cluster assembly protein SufD [Bradyrhizobiaceae bacterium]|nr:Fe-S cluster assembly protein SufD [Bradyrhizobiaceae bacterium]